MLLLSEFYLRRALKLAQEQEVTEDRRRLRNERQSLSAAETSEQRSEKAKGERSC